MSLEEGGRKEPDGSLLLHFLLGCFWRVSHQEGERLVGFSGSVFRVRIEMSVEGFFGESVDHDDADHDAPELRLRHFVFCLEGALDSLFSVEKELEVLVFCEGWWLISVKKELDVSVAIFAIRKFLHFLCGFRGGSTPGTFVGLNKSLWFC